MSEAENKNQSADDIAERLARLESKVLRMETQTRLARNVQDFSKAAQIVWSALGCLGRVVKRVALLGAILYVGAYMVFHNGQPPLWAAEIYKFIKGD